MSSSFVTPQDNHCPPELVLKYKFFIFLNLILQHTGVVWKESCRYLKIKQRADPARWPSPGPFLWREKGYIQAADTVDIPLETPPPTAQRACDGDTVSTVIYLARREEEGWPTCSWLSDGRKMKCVQAGVAAPGEAVTCALRDVTAHPRGMRQTVSTKITSMLSIPRVVEANSCQLLEWLGAWNPVMNTR